MKYRKKLKVDINNTDSVTERAALQQTFRILFQMMVELKPMF